MTTAITVELECDGDGCRSRIVCGTDVRVEPDFVAESALRQCQESAIAAGWRYDTTALGEAVNWRCPHCHSPAHAYDCGKIEPARPSPRLFAWVRKACAGWWPWRKEAD